MSWLVATLWNNRERIKNKSRKDNGIDYSHALLDIETSEFNDDNQGYDDPFIENDEFNDLLIIEKAIAELQDLGLITQEELNVLNSEKHDYRTKKQKETYHRKLDYICERVGYYIGNHFTDEGYIEYLSTKYKLTSEQQDIIRAYIKSEFKNKTLRKGYKVKNEINLVSA